MSSLPSLPPSHPSRSSQSSRLGPLCYRVAYHQLSILHIVVYKHQCYSLNLSHPLLPLCPQECPPHLHLYSFSANRTIRASLLDFIYIYALRYYFCFSLTYFTLYNMLSRFISFELTQIHSFLWLGNILYNIYCILWTICTTTSLSIHLSVEIQVASKSWLL